MSCIEVEFPLRAASVAQLDTALEELGALSVTLLDEFDDPVLEPLPGEIRLWKRTLVRALFPAELDATALMIAITARLNLDPQHPLKLRTIADRVWEREWLKDWGPRQFGSRLWIYPTEHAPPEDPRAVVVWLDPGLAFGTGTHPTTAQCLTVLDSLDLNGRHVIDYGCGSGVLCIAALKLGAESAVGVDIDVQALTATRENAMRNGVADQLRTCRAEAAFNPADCVVANILAGPLIELAPHLTDMCRANADLILSGILDTQLESVLAAYAPWFDIVAHLQSETWCCIHARRRATIRS
jgi:ribosomal protein L11 methyltransferase